MVSIYLKKRSMLEFKDYLINERGYTPDREDHNHFSTSDGRSLRLKLDPPEHEIVGEDYPVQFIFGIGEEDQGVKILAPWLFEKIEKYVMVNGMVERTYYPMSDTKQYSILKRLGNEGFYTYVKYIQQREL